MSHNETRDPRQSENPDETPRPVIKVLHIATGLNAGGVGRMLDSWYANTDLTKIEYHIASLDAGGVFGESLKAQGCRISQIKPLRDVKVLGYLRQIDRIMRRDHYDIVHSHVGIVSALVFMPAILRGVKCRILHGHGSRYTNDSGKGLNGAFMWLLRIMNVYLSTLQISCSSSAADYIVPSPLVKKRLRSLVLMNGIEPDEFAFDSEARESTRRELSCPVNSFVIGQVGRYSQEKNQRFAIEILHQLLPMRPDSVLWLIGEGPDEHELRAMASELQISAKVFFIPPSQYVAKYMHGMDAFLLPSVSEGLGLVAIEAQVSGLPCFVSGGVPAEVDVDGRVKFISLTCPASYWAIQLSASSSERLPLRSTLRGSKYDIRESASNLQAIYHQARR